MKVTVGGTEYEIEGILHGTRPAWHLIKIAGTPMTSAQFLALPTAEQQALVAHVQRHLEAMQGR